MGGGKKSSSSFSSSPDDQSSLDDDKSQRSSSDGLGLEFLQESLSDFDSEEFDQIGHHRNSSNHFQLGDMRRRVGLKAHIISSYKDSFAPMESLDEAKQLLLSYTPGSWIDKEEGEKLSDFDVPKTTTLLLVGFRGSGKSSLINRISRVFEDDKFASDRAQVSYCSSPGDGTYFLQGYMIPKRSNSFCLFDTRSLSNQAYENDDLIKSLMTKGVRSGDLVIRDSDYSSLRTRLKCKIRDGGTVAEPIRKVNFVIFVIDGHSVLRYMNSDKEEDTRHAEMLAQTFNFPYLSFRDDKPVIVVTRGDSLSLEERASVRIYLGELLGIPPATQIFDIPESCDPVTELAILEMLKYSLEHADKNLPHKSWVCRNLCPVKSIFRQVLNTYIIAILFLGLALGMHVAIEQGWPLGHQAPWCKPHLDHPAQPPFNLTTPPASSDCYHHEPLANRTLDHPAQPHFKSSAHQEDPEATRETSSTVDLELSNSTTQANSSHSASNETTPELHPPQAQPTPSQKVTDKPHTSLSRFAKHNSRNKRPEKPKKKNRPSKQREPTVSEPETTISWEARQRLWLVE